MYHKNYPFTELDVFKEEVFSKTNANYIGRILTIVDSSVTGQQGKAMKDLIKREMWEYLQDTFEDFRRLQAHTIRMIESVWVNDVIKESDEEMRDMSKRLTEKDEKIKIIISEFNKATPEEKIAMANKAIKEMENSN